MRSLPTGDARAHLDHLREAETLADGLDDPRRLGRVSLYMSEYFCSHGRRMTMPSQLASAPSRSPRPVGMSSCRSLANAYLGLVYYVQGDYRRAMDFLGRSVASLEGELLR